MSGNRTTRVARAGHQRVDPVWEARGPGSEESGRPWEETSSIHVSMVLATSDGILTGSDEGSGRLGLSRRHTSLRAQHPDTQIRVG